MLETYDEDLEAYEVFEPSDDANGLEELMYESSVQELQRLRGMNVLMEMESGNASADDLNAFSTRLVRTWREKVFGECRVWLRRSTRVFMAC